MQLSSYASQGLLLWCGGTKVAAGEMSVGRLTEFLTYLTILQGPIRQIAMIFNSPARATSSGSRLFEVLDLNPEVGHPPGAKAPAPTQGVPPFAHLDFHYRTAG